MPYATNRLDRTRVYFADDAGGGAAVVLHGGLLDSVDDVRESKLAQALPPDEFRLIYVDHRGLGRLGFAIGEHKPERVLSLVIGGQQPYAWPDSPLTRVVTDGLAASQTEGMEALVQAFESFWDVRFPDRQRSRWLDNDPAALQAAWSTALAEGAVAEDLRAWQIPCLIFIGAGCRLPRSGPSCGGRDPERRDHRAR
jgi:pimeloyl-ACP methyl ester carboxylesterase